MTDDIEQGSARWKGRNKKKDALRAAIWSRLEAAGVAIGSPWSHIPNFVGAERAAARLAELPFWKAANIVKSNPDKPQIPVRLQALKEGKLVYTPVPELVKDFPFILLDPRELTKRGVPFEDAATSEGSLKYGKRVRFQEMMLLDIAVVGCVAVTRAGGRTGKGGGFADLELGIFREFNLISPETPVVTTVHPIQVVDDGELPMVAHDTPLDWIITTDETIETRTQYARPATMDWNAVQPDQYRNIPFLEELRKTLAAHQP